MNKYFFILILSSFFSGCFSDEKPNISRDELLKRGRIGDPELKVLVPKSISDSLINCGDYTPPCRFGYIVVIKKIKLKVLAYEKQSDALVAAKRVRGYVARNWVFEDVTGEPILERFVQKHFGAVKVESLNSVKNK